MPNLDFYHQPVRRRGRGHHRIYRIGPFTGRFRLQNLSIFKSRLPSRCHEPTSSRIAFRFGARAGIRDSGGSRARIGRRLRQQIAHLAGISWCSVIASTRVRSLVCRPTRNSSRWAPAESLRPWPHRSVRHPADRGSSNCHSPLEPWLRTYRKPSRLGVNSTAMQSPPRNTVSGPTSRARLLVDRRAVRYIEAEMMLGRHRRGASRSSK